MVGQINCCLSNNDYRNAPTCIPQSWRQGKFRVLVQRLASNSKKNPHSLILMTCAMNLWILRSNNICVSLGEWWMSIPAGFEKVTLSFVDARRLMQHWRHWKHLRSCMLSQEDRKETEQRHETPPSIASLAVGPKNRAMRKRLPTSQQMLMLV